MCPQQYTNDSPSATCAPVDTTNCAEDATRLVMNRHEYGREYEDVFHTLTRVDSTTSNAPSSTASNYGPSLHDSKNPKGPCPHPLASRCSSSPITSSGYSHGISHFSFTAEDRRPGFGRANRTKAQVSGMQGSRAVCYEQSRSAGMQDTCSTESSERKRVQLGASPSPVDRYSDESFADGNVDDTRSLPDNSPVPSVSFASSSDSGNVEENTLQIEVSAHSGQFNGGTQ